MPKLRHIGNGYHGHDKDNPDASAVISVVKGDVVDLGLKMANHLLDTEPDWWEEVEDVVHAITGTDDHEESADDSDGSEGDEEEAKPAPRRGRAK